MAELRRLDRRGNLYAMTRDSVMRFHAHSAGNVPPAAVIYGPATGLSGEASALAIDRGGDIYVARSSFKDPAVLRYAPDSAGNKGPLAVLSGDETALDHPTAIAIGSR